MASNSANADKGKWGEDVAVRYLVRQGYALMYRNWRMGHYEIDVIMQKGQYVVFVEVKTRNGAESDAVGAVDTRKRAKMVASADAFLKKYDLPFEYRFDIVAVIGTEANHTVEHIPDAFFPQLKKFNYSFRL